MTIRAGWARSAFVIAPVLIGCARLAAAAAPMPTTYPAEVNYNTAAWPDEAAVNVRVRNNRWPDCYSLETAIADVFRLEGVNDTPDATEAKAFAAWKWMMTLMSISGGRVYEGNPAGPKVQCVGDRDTQQIEVRHGDKLLMVYGVHECGGLSRVLAHLWTAAGFLGYQEASSGHSTAALRYPDKDGVWRMHTFNPQGRSYYWDERDGRVGARRRPVMSGVEYKGFLAPMSHTLRTSLRLGETVKRRWANDGYVQVTEGMNYWEKRGPNKQIGIHCVAGQEDQTLTAVTDPARFRSQLWKDSQNVACSPAAADKATLHPAEAGKPASFIYRLASPYVAIECEVQGKFRKSDKADACRLAFSTDGGKTWHTFYEKTEAGAEAAKASVGRELYRKPAPTITSHYEFLIKAEFQTAGDVRGVGMDELTIIVHRQLNMRVLPNLMPGENVIAASADALPEGLALELCFDYEVNGQPRSVRQVIGELKRPHYARIDVNDVPADKLIAPGYLAKWGDEYSFNLPSHPLRMKAMTMTLVPVAGAKLDASLPAEQAEPFFAKAYPNPYENNKRMIDKTKDPAAESEVSGFLPQIPRTKDQPADPLAYYNWLIENIGTTDSKLPKLEAGADPVTWCIEQLPRAQSSRTLGVCNVLAHFADKRAVPALLAKWKAAPSAGPGDRYVADALAAAGDRSAAAALAERTRELRFDYRVHVAHALAVLGGPEARAALERMAKDDPNISVRGEAARGLAAMKD